MADLRRGMAEIGMAAWGELGRGRPGASSGEGWPSSGKEGEIWAAGVWPEWQCTCNMTLEQG